MRAANGFRYSRRRFRVDFCINGVRVAWVVASVLWDDPRAMDHVRAEIRAELLEAGWHPADAEEITSRPVKGLRR